MTLSYGQTEKAWSLSKQKSVLKNKNVERESFPQQFKLMQLDVAILQEALSSASSRSSATAKSVIITLPNAEGVLENFEVFEASNFDTDLQAQFPEIRSYAGNGVDDKTAIVRISMDPRGIQTMVSRADKATEFMEPYSQDGKVYAIYNSSRTKGKLPFTCSTSDQNIASDLSSTFGTVSRSSSNQLLTFRLALSCNGEYANYFGASTWGTTADKALVLAAFNATMTRVNGVFEKDFAIHMNIVSQTTNVIYCNPSTDPYSTTLANWNVELQNTLSSSLTGASTTLAANNAAYDVGHMFGSTGGGGNAGCIGCVCTDDTSSTTDENKGAGITSPSDGIPMGDNFDIDYVAHELGHQFGANHTFSNSSEGTGVNKEVGSGVTIMGYAGITSYDTHSHSIDVFHSASIQQVQTNMATKTCPTVTSITHSAPVVNAGSDYTIPKSTPFMLTGAATDAGGATGLTYTWEQNDNVSGQTGASSAASETKSSGPNWVNYVDSASPVRYFPIMSSVFAGSTTTAGLDITAEALSSVGRTLNFRLTARDNVAGQGQTGYDDAIITVDGTKGPLTVTSQNTDGIIWTPGSTETITWTVNSTNTISGGANVDILYTTDSGVTWTAILTNTLNDGSQAITVPNVSAASCRIMVKANANVFFNVNSKNIAIGDYTYETQDICTDYVLDLNTAIAESTANSYSGYALSITDSYTITDIKTHVDITHSNIGQVNVLFWFPWSTSLNTAIWYSQTTCTGANMDKWFDLAGSTADCSTVGGSPFLPYSVTNFTSAIGQNSAGSWLVYFKDGVVDSSGGTFNTLTIQLCRSEQVAVLATESFGIDGFSLYPNPNNGTFNVQFTSTSSNDIKVSVHDLRGREIYNNSYRNNGLFNESLQLNNVQSGVYLVTVQDGSRKEVKKIIVK
jgi:subtilisin-like proprotein convertase family protein